MRVISWFCLITNSSFKFLICGFEFRFVFLIIVNSLISSGSLPLNLFIISEEVIPSKYGKIEYNLPSNLIFTIFDF